MEQVQHLIKAIQLSPENVERWIKRAEEYEKSLREKSSTFDELKGVTIASLYFEPSTRTRLCLDKAGINLGATVLGPEDPGVFSAMAPGKEESFEDTIRVISGIKTPHLRIADIIILRHTDRGAAEIAAEVSGVPVLNAGDGDGNHPTQALTDQLSFKIFLGRLRDLTIAFIGDLLNSRIIEDDIVLLSDQPGFKPIFVSPPGLGIKESLRSFLVARHIEFSEADDIKKVITECDAGYIVRVQKNRIEDEQYLSLYQEIRDNFALTQEVYDMTEKRGTLFFHPMPVSKVEKEIRPELALLSRVKMYQQALLKIPVGMVALTELWRTYQATH